VTTQQIKRAIAARLAEVPDTAPERMLKRVLDLLEELAKPEVDASRVERFLKNIEEDRDLLHRLAQ
jgi:hypothetical protein